MSGSSGRGDKQQDPAIQALSQDGQDGGRAPRAEGSEESLARSSAELSPASLEQLLLEKESQVQRLSKQLQHYRSWVASVHVRVQHMNPKAVQNAKRLYVGNLPADATEEELCAFLNQLMVQTGAQIGPEPAVVQCHLTQERNFAFAEFRTVEETSNAMGLDGVAWRETFLKIRRPSNYDLATSLMLGPLTPDPTMDISRLILSKPIQEDSPNKLFVGGLPCEWPESAVRMILEPWGSLKAFNLVMDKATGNSKGYAFCEYADTSVTDKAIAGLNGQRAGTKTLTVKRAAEGARQASAGVPAPGMPSNATPTLSSAGSGFDDGRGLTFGAGSSGRKSVGAVGGPGSHPTTTYIMTPPGVGVVMAPGMTMPVPGRPGTQSYGPMGITRPDSQLQHLSPMQQHVVQPYMTHPGQPHPMHFSASPMMMPMAPGGGIMMQGAPAFTDHTQGRAGRVHHTAGGPRSGSSGQGLGGPGHAGSVPGGQ